MPNFGDDSRLSIQVNQITLTAQQIKNLVNSPVEIVAAIGGRVLVPLVFLVEYRAGSVDFGNLAAGQLAATYSDANNVIADILTGNSMFGTVSPQVNRFTSNTPLGFALNVSDLVSKSLKLTNDSSGGDFTNGNGTITVTTYYTHLDGRSPAPAGNARKNRLLLLSLSG